jgi:hypothetical protein
MQENAIMDAQIRKEKPAVETVLATKSHKKALACLRRLRSEGAVAGLVRIEGFYTKTGMRFRRYEVRKVNLEEKGR